MTHVTAIPYLTVTRARDVHKGDSRHMRHWPPFADGKSASPSNPRPVAWRRHLNPRFSRHWTNRFMVPAGSPALSAQSFHEANSVLELSQASGRRWHLSSIQAAMSVLGLKVGTSCSGDRFRRRQTVLLPFQTTRNRPGENARPFGPEAFG